MGAIRGPNWIGIVNDVTREATEYSAREIEHPDILVRVDRSDQRHAPAIGRHGWTRGPGVVGTPDSVNLFARPVKPHELPLPTSATGSIHDRPRGRSGQRRQVVHGINRYVLGHRGWVANEQQLDWIKRLRKKRPLPDEQQVPTCVDRRRIRVEQTSCLEAVELTDIHPTCLGRSLHVVEKMTAIGQKLRRAVTDLLRHLQSRDRRRFTAGCGDTENRRTRGPREKHYTIAIPGAAAHAGRVRQRLDRFAIDVNALQPVLSQKPYRAVVRRPEYVLRPFGARQCAGGAGTERAQP